MNFEETKKLEIERLILRKFKTKDVQKVFKNYASSDDVMKYLTWETHDSVDTTKNI